MPGMPIAVRTTWQVTAWPLSIAMPPLAALPTAPGCARADVRAVLSAWEMAALTEIAELVVDELVTNAVCASARSGTTASHMAESTTPVIRTCLLADSTWLRAEIWDQADGVPVLGQAPMHAESGRGLAIVDAITEGRWGWYPAPRGQKGKCVWAEMRLPPN